MNPKIPATAAMLVKNSERYLTEVLTALQDFDEVLLPKPALKPTALVKRPR